MKTIIIEDEELARELLKSYLKDYSAIEVINECSDGFAGIKAINELKPDLIFLDIQMPKINGFEMLELIDNKPIIIFTTAYDQFAIKAFEMNTVDYLLKPFSKKRFKAAIDKAFNKYNNLSKETKSLDKLIKHVENSKDALQRIIVKTGTKINVIPVKKIKYFEAQDDYVMIYTEEGKYLKQKTMKYFEEHLPSSQFIRIHRSYIVNIDQIAGLELYEKESYIVKLKDNSKLKVSKNGYKALKSTLNF
ncbi:MAG: response regulator transcription factor [Bacteroidales bacterium]|nr:response regulator transcription factor [Bacteroidales bacterium]